jgi:hypothetical protein
LLSTAFMFGVLHATENACRLGSSRHVGWGLYFPRLHAMGLAPVRGVFGKVSEIGAIVQQHELLFI